MRAAALVAAAIAGTTLVPGAARAADPTMTASSASVAVGGTIDVTVDQCDTIAPEGGEDPDRFPQVFLVTGTGAQAKRAAIGARVSGSTFRLTVPGWVDPDDPAVVAGACDEHFYGHGPGKHWQRRFSYPDVPVDVTPAGAPVAHPTFLFTRSSAAAGQRVSVVGSGCAPGEPVIVDVDPGDDLAWRDGPTTYFELDAPGMSSANRTAGPDGTFEVPLTLNSLGSRYEPGFADDPAAGPLAEGPYEVRVGCGDRSSDLGAQPDPEAEPQVLSVVGTTASDSMRVGPAPTRLGVERATGKGCAGGQTIRLGWSPQWTDPPALTITVVPDGDGRWSFDRVPSTEERQYWFAECGTPDQDGFVYVFRFAAVPTTSDLTVTEISPASPLAGEDLVISVDGACIGDVDAVLADADGNVVAVSDPIAGDVAEHTYRLNLTAPDDAGDYLAAGRCGVAAGPTVDVEVLAAGEATPATPVSGDSSFTG